MQQAQFDAEFAKDKRKAEKFLKQFYAHRKKMQAENPKKWGKLQKEFPRIVAFVKAMQAEHDVYIATTKNKAAVVDLLAQYGLQIPESRVYSKDFSKDKAVQLREIAKRAGVPLGRVVLVEDAVKQAKKARTMGAKGVIVPYGYSTKAQRKGARKEGISQLTVGPKGRKQMRRLIRRGRK